MVFWVGFTIRQLGKQGQILFPADVFTRFPALLERFLALPGVHQHGHFFRQGDGHQLVDTHTLEFSHVLEVFVQTFWKTNAHCAHKFLVIVPLLLQAVEEIVPV